MRSVYKFQMLGPAFELDMDISGDIIHVAEQGGVPCLWAVVNPKGEKMKRRFKIFGTGHEIGENDLAWRGTFFTEGVPSCGTCLSFCGNYLLGVT